MVDGGSLEVFGVKTVQGVLGALVGRWLMQEEDSGWDRKRRL